MQTSTSGHQSPEIAESFTRPDDAIFGGNSGPIANISTTASRHEDIAGPSRFRKLAKKFSGWNHKTPEERSGSEAMVVDNAVPEYMGQGTSARNNELHESPLGLQTNLADIVTTQKAAKNEQNSKHRKDAPSLETNITDVTTTQKAGKRLAAWRNKKKKDNEKSGTEETTE